MALIKTIAEVKSFLKISNFNSAASLPDMDAAAIEYLIPYVGQDLYDEIDDAYNADQAGMSAQQKELLKRLQRSVVFWAYFSNLAFINAMITDRGVTYTQTADMPPVSRWSFLQLKEALRDGAFSAMERSLQYLEANADTFPSWADSAERQAYRRLLIRNGYEFSGIYSLYQPLRTFIAMKGTMAMVEEMYLEPEVGTDFLQSLKDNQEPSIPESLAISWLKKAAAYLTIWHAIQELPVRISEAGFTVLGANGAPDSPDQGRMADDSSLLGMKLAAAKREGDHYMARAKKYLDQNASSDLFPEYFSGDAYTAPGEDDAAILDNANRKIFRF